MLQKLALDEPLFGSGKTPSRRYLLTVLCWQLNQMQGSSLKLFNERKNLPVILDNLGHIMVAMDKMISWQGHPHRIHNGHKKSMLIESLKYW
jgi:hypothetical protein